jgi:hypothetical protein
MERLAQNEKCPVDDGAIRAEGTSDKRSLAGLTMLKRRNAARVPSSAKNLFR